MAAHYKNKRLWMCVVCLTLSACAGHQVKDTSEQQPVLGKAVIEQPNETLLQAAENYAGLISLYKQQLEQTETAEQEDNIRLKIAGAYLGAQDPESALFYLDPVIEQGRGSADLFLLKSKSLLVISDYQQALKAAITAYGFGADNPEIFNLMGQAQVYLGYLPSARRNFEKARKGGLDDLKAQNNLAMLDILEGHYDAAAKRLTALYRTGQADDQVKANLASGSGKKRPVPGVLNHYRFWQERRRKDRAVPGFGDYRACDTQGTNSEKISSG